MIQEQSLTITKEEIAKLPQEDFAGRIFVVITEDEARRAVDYLMKFPLVGFDTETRPNFRKGQSNKVALMQISTEDTCFLFRLNRIGIPDSLEALLASEDVKKIGLSLRDDFGALRQRSEMLPSNFIDLQKIVGDYGIEVSSLQKIYALLFKKKIAKGQRLTNWEADTLTDAQKRYAALDAWACLKIYNHLNNAWDHETK